MKLLFYYISKNSKSFLSLSIKPVEFCKLISLSLNLLNFAFATIWEGDPFGEYLQMEKLNISEKIVDVYFCLGMKKGY